MLVKKIARRIVGWILLLSAMTAQPVSAQETPAAGAPSSPEPAVSGSTPAIQVNAKAALLMEPITGQILLSQNPHEKLPPASVTKVMTMLLIFEAIEQGKISWDDIVTTSEHAASMGGSQVYLESMEQQSVRDLVKSVVIASGNDAAVAMAEFIAGSEDAFVTMMNNRAKELDMNDTHFINACGLDTPGHLTSAYDIAVMTRELIVKHPSVFNYSKIWMDKIEHKTARGIQDFGLSNTNRLLKSYPAATGLKTGSTSEALYCISATALKNGLQLNAVILGAPDPNTRFGEAIKMMDYGYANYAMASGDAVDTIAGEIAVVKGNLQKVNVKIRNQVSALIPKGKSVELERKVELLNAVPAPFKANTKAGVAIYFHEGKEVGRSDLVTVEDAARAALSDIMGRVLVRWFK
ncbi:MAG: D-alanyl-D-alanine carboxypeptidase [Clostridiales bacterium]|jgi:D-alanyl-D-alanine carboxypeptidase (penicillin-binding protein 5/6)|nr:D-alanyl-D-alanine carboxypeptidase [Clostridiales bacterium]